MITTLQYSNILSIYQPSFLFFFAVKMSLRQLALNLQQEIATGGDLHSVKERLHGLKSAELQELCSFRVDGRTLVATIAATNKWDLLDYLIKEGVKVHEVDETILHFAVVQKAENIVKLLTKSGIDVNHARDDGKTPLHVASEYGHTDIVKFLLENGAEKSMSMTERSGCTPLTLAAMTGQTPVMSELIKHGANINVRSGFPPLHAAALLGHTKIIHLLLENKADVNLWDAAKALAIHYAAMKNHKHVVQELIDRGSDLRTKDSRGNLPLNLAKSKEVKQIIRKAMGLDTDSTDEKNPVPSSSSGIKHSEGKSPLSLAHSTFYTHNSRPTSEPETGEIENPKEQPKRESSEQVDISVSENQKSEVLKQSDKEEEGQRHQEHTKSDVCKKSYKEALSEDDIEIIEISDVKEESTASETNKTVENSQRDENNISSENGEIDNKGSGREVGAAEIVDRGTDVVKENKQSTTKQNGKKSKSSKKEKVKKEKCKKETKEKSPRKKTKGKEIVKDKDKNDREKLSKDTELNQSKANENEKETEKKKTTPKETQEESENNRVKEDENIEQGIKETKADKGIPDSQTEQENKKNEITEAKEPASKKPPGKGSPNKASPRKKKSKDSSCHLL